MDLSKNRVVLSILVIYLIFLLNAWIGSLRFAKESLDYAFILIILALPFMRVSRTKNSRVVDAVGEKRSMAFLRVFIWLAAILGLPLAAFGLYNSVAPASNTLQFTKKVRSFQYNNFSYHVVYENFGALDDGSVRVIQERPFCGIFLISRTVLTCAFYDDVETKPSGDGGFWLRPKGSNKSYTFVSVGK